MSCRLFNILSFVCNLLFPSLRYRLPVRKCGSIDLVSMSKSEVNDVSYLDTTSEVTSKISDQGISFHILLLSEAD